MKSSDPMAMMMAPTPVHTGLCRVVPRKLTARTQVRAPMLVALAIKPDFELVSWNCTSRAGRLMFVIPFTA